MIQITFPKMQLYMEQLEQDQAPYPRTKFEAYQCENNWEIVYPEADVFFQDKTLEKVLRQLVIFLESDTYIRKLGKPVLKKI